MLGCSWSIALDDGLKPQTMSGIHMLKRVDYRRRENDAGSFGGFAYYCWALAGVVIVVF